MKQTGIITVLSIALLLLIGCEKDQQSAVEILSITPANGETNVLKTVEVQVEFNESMESSSCESRFGLFQGVLESIPSNMMGSMEGEFTWNNDHTMMTFHSDSMLMDSNMYSICLEEGMMAENMMGDGMMMSNMDDHGMETANGIISKFTTGDFSLARIVSVNPVNGATEIDKNSEIQIEFMNPMDTESCESRFGLHLGDLDEMPTMGMGMGMMPGLEGSFHWNHDSTMMNFHPDSMLMDSSMYTICLMEGMESANHNGTMMLSNMSDHGMEADSGILSKFFTK